MSQVLLIIGVALFVVFFFGFCIFIHELGHFLAAKWRGLHIVAFSIGFRKIWGFKWKGVDFRVGWIPFGGYVDLPQIDATGPPTSEDGTPLPRAKPLDRILTAFAGPLFNLLFGFALGVVIWIHGIPQDTPRMDAIVVAEVDEGSPEREAGLLPDDVIVKVNGERFYSTWSGIVRKIIFTIGKVRLDVVRGDERRTIVYTPKENPNVMPDEKIAYPFFKPKVPVTLYPLPGSPADNAGVQPGDRVISVNGREIRYREELESLLGKSGGKPLQFVLERNGERKRLMIKPELNDENEVFRIGIKYVSKVPLVVGEVLPDSAAAKAGLERGDVIVSMNGNAIANPESFARSIQTGGGRPLLLEINRGGDVSRQVLVPKRRRLHTIGVHYAYYNYPSPWRQFLTVMDMSYKTLRGIFSKQNKLKARHLSGPIGIVRVISIAVYRGSFMQGLHIIVWITFSLAILNLLPIPVLDGGHILLAVLEVILRRPLPEQVVKAVMYACLGLLISFMLYVSYYDVGRTIRDFTGGAGRRSKSANGKGIKSPGQSSIGGADESDSARFDE